MAGAAVDVFIGEIAKLTGTCVSGDNAWEELLSWIGSPDSVHSSTLLVVLVGLLVIFGTRIVGALGTGALVLVVGGLLAS